MPSESDTGYDNVPFVRHFAYASKLFKSMLCYLRTYRRASHFIVFFVFLSLAHGQRNNSRRIIYRFGQGSIPLGPDEKFRSLLHRDETFSIGYELLTSGLTQAERRRDGSGKGVILKRQLVQRLDHFDGMNSRRWNQTYWVNDQFYEKGGPIFLFITSGAIDDDYYWIGGEDTLPDWLVKAKKFKALCFLLEHRYYGESRPTKSLYVTSMRFLSTYQALGDVANFIANVTVEYQLVGSPWVLFGCSYAGALAAWSRLKFPHLVSIAVASGAPLEPKLDFSEYAEIVTKALRAESKPCVENIRNATMTMEMWLQDPGKLSRLNKLFRFCEDLDAKDKKNVSLFFAQLGENIFNIVQGSKINRGLAKYNLTTSTICKIMANASLGDYVTRYAFLHRMYFAYHGIDCFSTSYYHLIEQLKDERYHLDNWRQWNYQACTEFGFYTTSNSPYQPFGHLFDLDYYMNQCVDAFGIPLSKPLETNVEETLRQYGGKNPKVDRVVFTYGTVDPWSPLGPLQSFGNVKVIPIEGSSHCSDFYAPDDLTDSTELKSARRQVDRILSKWISSSSSKTCSNYFLIIAFLLLLTAQRITQCENNT